MDFQTARKSIDLFLDNKEHHKKRKSIKFFGGEPLLEMDLMKKIVEYARKKNLSNINFELTTNGILLNKNFLNWAKLNDVKLTISLDGDKKTQTRNRLSIDNNEIKNYKKLIKLKDGYFKDIIVIYR